MNKKAIVAYIGIFIILNLAASCVSSISSASMNESLSYKYADGSGNVYHVTRSTLEFIPVTRTESSSLVYSGGTHAKVTLQENDFIQLQELLDRYLHQRELHIENRVMMSGLIIREENGKKTQAILRPGVREILTIETELNNILSRTQ